MSIRKVTCVLIFLFAILVFTSGCTEYSFGDPTYNDSKLNIQVYNSGNERNSTVQITIFSLENFRQIETGKYVENVCLKSGLNKYSFPVELEKGSYKLYLYVLEDKKRAAAEIRDITIR